MPNVLMVIDMLNGFLQPGRNLYCGDHSRLIIPKVADLIDKELSMGSDIIFICDSHDPDGVQERQIHSLPLSPCWQGTVHVPAW